MHQGLGGRQRLKIQGHKGLRFLDGGCRAWKAAVAGLLVLCPIWPRDQDDGWPDWVTPSLTCCCSCNEAASLGRGKAWKVNINHKKALACPGPQRCLLSGETHAARFTAHHRQEKNSQANGKASSSVVQVNLIVAGGICVTPRQGRAVCLLVPVGEIVSGCERWPGPLAQQSFSQQAPGSSKRFLFVLVEGAWLQVSLAAVGRLPGMLIVEARALAGAESLQEPAGSPSCFFQEERALPDTTGHRQSEPFCLPVGPL